MCFVLSTGTQLFVVGGDPTTSNFDVEVVDLSKSNVTCPKPADCPLKGSPVSTFMGDKVIVCGGQNGSFISTNQCFNYDKDLNVWKETFSLKEIRAYAAAVQLTPEKWWITGGFSNHGVLQSTEMFTLGSGIESFMDLPVQLHSHNLVKINSNHVILLGGKAIQCTLYLLIYKSLISASLLYVSFV